MIEAIRRARHAAVRLPSFLLAGALLLGAAVPPAVGQPWKRDRPYPDGSEIRVTGVVRDVDGEPVGGVVVELVAARVSNSLFTGRETVEREVSVRARTNDAGEYEIPWTWYRYYNDFELRALLPVPLGGDETRDELLASSSLDNRIGMGSPVVVPLTVTDPGFLKTFRRFVADLDTDDELRVYTNQGRPDKVDALDLPDRTEESWWYFSRGQVYRFVDGRLDGVESFDPIDG